MASDATNIIYVHILSGRNLCQDKVTYPEETNF